MSFKRFIVPGGQRILYIHIYLGLLGNGELVIITEHRKQLEQELRATTPLRQFACPTCYFGDCGNESFFHGDAPYFNLDLEERVRSY